MLKKYKDRLKINKILLSDNSVLFCENNINLSKPSTIALLIAIFAALANPLLLLFLINLILKLKFSFIFA